MANQWSLRRSAATRTERIEERLEIIKILIVKNPLANTGEIDNVLRRIGTMEPNSIDVVIRRCENGIALLGEVSSVLKSEKKRLEATRQVTNFTFRLSVAPAAALCLRQCVIAL